MLFKRQDNYFKSIDTLRILTFWKILKDKNPFLLDLDYFEGKRYTKRQKNEIDQIWTRLYDEYFILRDDSISKTQLIKSFEGLQLKANILLLKHSIDAFHLLNNEAHRMPYDKLYSMRFKMYESLKIISSKIQFQHFNSVDLDIKYLTKFYNSMYNSYQLNHKKEETVNKEQIKNVYSVVANAESWMGRSLNIDTMVVSHWLAVERQVLNKQKAEKNGK